MRRALWVVGTLLILLGLAGLATLALGPSNLTEPVSVSTSLPVQSAAASSTDSPAGSVASEPTTVATETPPLARTVAVEAEVEVEVEVAQPTHTPTPVVTPTPVAPPRPITWLGISRINLETVVVPAEMVEDGDSVTWNIPKFVAGHAETTAGAGQVGNAVILGHLVSQTLGNVFEHLDRTKPGDVVQIRSDADEFDYVVTDVMNVDRTDVDVLDPTPTATITLITCAGVWNPVLHDYMQRLIVRAELDGSSR